MPECWPFRLAGYGCVAVFIALSGCAGLDDATIGGRPLIYKQGPGDPPSTIKEKAGVVVKRSPPPAEPSSKAAESSAPAPAPAATPAREAEPKPATRPAERSAPKPIAAAQPPAPRTPVASGATAGSADLFNRYTQATRYGDLLFVSGQIAIDHVSGAFDANQDIQAQTLRTLQNIQLILENNRLTMANVVSVTVYLSNINHFATMDAVYQGFFKGTPPARSVVEVGHLPRGALVEISVIAGR